LFLLISVNIPHSGDCRQHVRKLHESRREQVQLVVGKLLRHDVARRGYGGGEFTRVYAFIFFHNNPPYHYTGDLLLYENVN